MPYQSLLKAYIEMTSATTTMLSTITTLQSNGAVPPEWGYTEDESLLKALPGVIIFNIWQA
ncbi:MAG: hypothetical protein ACXAB5_04640 [Candidatus Thorarchaeota archaeon]